MSNVISLNDEREISALVDKLGQLISVNPDCAHRTKAALYGELEMKNSDSVLISIRLPKALVASLDEVSREQAYREKRKVTRSTLVVDWLDTMLKIHKQKQDEQLEQPDRQP